ncbi:type I polyketide synthase [Mycobacterium riyadhense]|uniref:type I polyketide synthase n=1 Tax=Mycobacterium riyadhense TaxID=486698 RepID=UPI001950920E|nr:type I polyketide synthase [Mycobacterium riyadhense]
MANSEELHSYLKQAVLELEKTRQRLREMEARIREPIAIVGMACRFPGGLNSPADLWRAVCEGRDLVAELPTDRGWDIANSDGWSGAPAGGFVSDVTGFDADFFGISAREALAIDPHQRIALEAAWEAFEHAGIDASTVRGSDTGVFLGMASILGGPPNGLASEDLDRPRPLGATSGASSMASGRISYFFGLCGPAITLDTGCSASLVAIHQAVRSLRSGECPLALAGGVTVLTQEGFAGLAAGKGSAAEGRCKSFAASADGAGWGEGVGILLLERLSDALENRHRVLAVIRGSAVNHDGPANGPDAPNRMAQQRVIRQALADAGLKASQVDVVEAHGTGTPLGDLTEVEALMETYGRHRPEGRPLWLGSLKSNVGHTLAAAGVGAVIKMVEAVRHRVIPATLHADEPNPYVDWSSGRVRLATKAHPWHSDGARRGGVSAFGASGVNAHLIVEEAVPEPSAAGEMTGPSCTSIPVVPWVITARSAQALPMQAARLAAHLEQNSDFRPIDVGLSLAASRATFDHRAVVVGRDRDELLDGLRSLAAGGTSSAVVRGVTEVPATTAMLFAGDGAQLLGAGRQLYSRFRVYANAFDEVCSIFDPRMDTSLRGLIFAEPDSPAAALLTQAAYAQPALFTVEVALFRLAESWGLRPDLVIGDSLGEVTAAYVAGLWSLEDACHLVAKRGQLGETPSTEPALSEFSRLCRELTYHVPTIRVISGLTGAAIDANVWSSPQYWVDQVTQPGRFVEAVHWARWQEGVANFLDVGRCVDDDLAFVNALASAYVVGTPIDWASAFADSGARRVDLPTYAFQRQRLWPETVVSPKSRTVVPNAVDLWTSSVGDGESSGPPSTETERMLAEAIKHVLGITQVGREDRFLALGGDSVSAMQLATRVRAAGLPLSAQMIFDHPTVRRLAAALDQLATDGEHEGDVGVVDADSSQAMSMSGLSLAELAALPDVLAKIDAALS